MLSTSRTCAPVKHKEPGEVTGGHHWRYRCTSWQVGRPATPKTAPNAHLQNQWRKQANQLQHTKGSDDGKHCAQQQPRLRASSHLRGKPARLHLQHHGPSSTGRGPIQKEDVFVPNHRQTSRKMAWQSVWEERERRHTPGEAATQEDSSRPEQGAGYCNSCSSYIPPPVELLHGTINFRAMGRHPRVARMYSGPLREQSVLGTPPPERHASSSPQALGRVQPTQRQARTPLRQRLRGLPRTRRCQARRVRR